MPKRLCACGCGDQVTQKVESEHMNVLTPALLASQVLDQNQRLIDQKKRSHAVGFPAPFRQRVAMGPGNATEVDDVDHEDSLLLDCPGPSGLVDDDPSSLDSPMMIEEECEDIYMDHPGPSAGLMHDDSLLPDDSHEFFMDHSASSPLPNDDSVMGENLDGEVYVLQFFLFCLVYL